MGRGKQDRGACRGQLDIEGRGRGKMGGRGRRRSLSQ